MKYELRFKIHEDSRASYTMNHSLRILAVDPGYDRCGVAVIEGGTLLYSSCITTDKKDLFETRVHNITKELRTIIATHTPSVLALETLFFSTNQKTAMRVAETRGAITLVAVESGLSVREFSPQEVKIAVTSAGNADKKQVIAMVPRLVKLTHEPAYDDEYDAIALGIAASATLR
jgi:crossover junction endodeoxyribonuclease RuvC